MEQTQKKKTAKPYSPEFRERAVRLVMEHRDEYQSEAAALTVWRDSSIRKICHPYPQQITFRSGQKRGPCRWGQTYDPLVIEDCEECFNPITS